MEVLLENHRQGYAHISFEKQQRWHPVYRRDEPRNDIGKSRNSNGRYQK